MNKNTYPRLSDKSRLAMFAPTLVLVLGACSSAETQPKSELETPTATLSATIPPNPSSAPLPAPERSASPKNENCSQIDVTLSPGEELRGLNSAREVVWHLQDSPYDEDGYEVMFSHSYEHDNETVTTYAYVVPGQSLHQDLSNGESLDLVADFASASEPAGSIDIVGQICPASETAGQSV